MAPEEEHPAFIRGRGVDGGGQESASLISPIPRLRRSGKRCQRKTTTSQ
jgi:hypothetical protein